MKVEIDNPATWPGFAVPFIVHDLGGRDDYSTLVVGGLPNFAGPAQSVVGITRMERLPLGLSSAETIAKLAEADADLGHRALVIADLSSNHAHGEALARAFGPRRVIGCQITAGRQHGQGAQPLPFTAADGSRSAFLSWNVARTKLFEDLGLAIEQKALKIAPDVADKVAFVQEMGAIERIVSESGNIKYVCPSGSHDDLSISVALMVWASRQFGRPAVRSSGSRRPVPSASAWT